MQQFAAAMLLCAWGAAAEPAVEIQPPLPRRVIAEKFRSALDRKITATWKSVSLRSILHAIARERELAILLDRRIDPGRELSWEFSGRDLHTELVALAEAHGAALSVVGNTVYVGPPQSAQLRTLVRLREEEILHRDAVVAKDRDLDLVRKAPLVRKATVHWGDLARPADLVGQIAAKHKLELQGLEQVPHDLWAAGTIPAGSAVEALSLVLIQFDLTFEWVKDAAAIRIVPVPERVVLSHTYTPKGAAAESVAAKWREEIPGIDITVRGKEIEVRGTVEHHEAVAALLRPGASKGNSNGKPQTPPAPLSRQTFTLKVQRASARSVMQELEKRGVVFQFDEKALAAAGIDLETKINLEVEKASADDFFRALCEPLRLRFRIERNTVTLVPK